MKAKIKPDYFLKQIYQIRQLALYFALMCLFGFIYLDFKRFTDDLLNEVLMIRLIYQLFPILALLVVCHWQQSNPQHKHLIHSFISAAVVLVGVGHAEILVAAYEQARYFPKVGLVIILYYASIILVMPMLYSIISSILIIGIASYYYQAAGLPDEEVLSITVFYSAFAACCLFMNVVCSRILQNNLKLVNQIDIQANTDNLTKLCNRRYFFEKSSQIHENANRESKQFAILLVDLDYFKQINDAMGHDQGDRVLIQVADVLQSYCKRPLDMVARFGGDEFVMLLYDANEQYIESICSEIIQQIESISAQLSENNPHSKLGGSIGVVFNHSGQTHDIKTLISIADNALYEVKKNGKNGYRIADKSQLTQVSTANEN